MWHQKSHKNNPSNNCKLLNRYSAAYIKQRLTVVHAWRHPVMTCLVTRLAAELIYYCPNVFCKSTLIGKYNYITRVVSIQLQNLSLNTNFDNCTHFVFELQFINSHQYAYTIILYMTWCILLTQCYISFDSLFSMNYESFTTTSRWPCIWPCNINQT